MKWNRKRRRPTNLVLQNLALVLRHKTDLVQSLIAEQVCTVQSFHWRNKIQYSTETEALHTTAFDPAKRLATHDCSTASTHTTALKNTNDRIQSPGAKPHDSSSLVASSRSLLNSRNTTLNVSGLSSHEVNRSYEFSRSQVTRSMGGCPCPLKCFVHCHKATLTYGFEFLGSEAHLFLSPQTENALLSLVHAMASHGCPSISSSPSGRTTTGKDLAVVSQCNNYTFTNPYRSSWNL